jgi:hypothetical protein
VSRPATPEPTRGRAFRGLSLVFVLSFVNLAGLVLTVSALGGLAPWSRWQFVGAFGLLEAASGLASVIAPNIWHLPVAQLSTRDRTDVQLAASVLLLPHWGGLARCAAGLVCLGLAGWMEGVGGATLGLIPLVLAVAWVVLALSAILARIGVARPDRDVLQIVLRWGGRERELAPISIGAAGLQFLVTIATIPVVTVLAPSVLYRPELGPSASALLVSTAVSVVLAILVSALWWGRIRAEAPAEQQREAESRA